MSFVRHIELQNFLNVRVEINIKITGVIGRIVGDCPLPVVKHGLVFSDIYGNADTTSHGQTIYYTCEPGYVNGTDVPRCNNGTWTANALCTPGNSWNGTSHQSNSPGPHDSSQIVTLNRQ